jgi:hypothetical protein
MLGIVKPADALKHVGAMLGTLQCNEDNSCLQTAVCINRPFKGLRFLLSLRRVVTMLSRKIKQWDGILNTPHY